MSESTVYNLFISYAREDFEYARALYIHLKPLMESGRLNVFLDAKSLKAGDEWEKGIKKHLRETDAFIFLISESFFISDFCTKTELPVLIRRYLDEQIKCWPFLLEKYVYKNWPCEGIELGDIQAIGPYTKKQNLVPLKSLKKPDQRDQYTRVYHEVESWLDDLQQENCQTNVGKHEVQESEEPNRSQEPDEPIVIDPNDGESIKVKSRLPIFRKYFKYLLSMLLISAVAIFSIYSDSVNSEKREGINQLSQAYLQFIFKQDTGGLTKLAKRPFFFGELEIESKEEVRVLFERMFEKATQNLIQADELEQKTTMYRGAVLAHLALKLSEIPSYDFRKAGKIDVILDIYSKEEREKSTGPPPTIEFGAGEDIARADIHFEEFDESPIGLIHLYFSFEGRVPYLRGVKIL